MTLAQMPVLNPFAAHQRLHGILSGAVWPELYLGRRRAAELRAQRHRTLRDLRERHRPDRAAGRPPAQWRAPRHRPRAAQHSD